MFEDDLEYLEETREELEELMARIDALQSQLNEEN